MNKDRRLKSLEGAAGIPQQPDRIEVTVSEDGMVKVTEYGTPTHEPIKFSVRIRDK